jgi:hypothetical protein
MAPWTALVVGIFKRTKKAMVGFNVLLAPLLREILAFNER